MDKLTISQQRILVAKKANNIARRLSEVILLLYKTLVRPQLECCIQFWAPEYKRDMDILKSVLQKSTKMKGLKHLLYKEMLRTGIA